MDSFTKTLIFKELGKKLEEKCKGTQSGVEKWLQLFSISSPLFVADLLSFP